MVSIDIYINETTKYADLILPPAWAMKEDYVDIFFAQMSVRNAARWSPPVFARDEGDYFDWEILLKLARGLGGGPTGLAPIDRAIAIAGWLGLSWSPQLMLEFLLRTGRWGDAYLPWRRGLSLRKLRASPNGIDLGPLEPGIGHRIEHRDKRVHLEAGPVLDAWNRLNQTMKKAQTNTLVLIGRRDVRSNNSWMHNIEALARGAERCVLLVNPRDAARVGVSDGETALLESRVYRGEVRVKTTDDMALGVVSLPHGWGHSKSAPWQRVAGSRPGVSANDWTDDTVVESVVGQSVLNGVAVSLSRVTHEGDNEPIKTVTTRNNDIDLLE
jgi:anaerobic selenocysteine-containing dehydrogenase